MGTQVKMFSSISSYIWARPQDHNEDTNANVPAAAEVEDWVVVGASSPNMFKTKKEEHREALKPSSQHKAKSRSNLQQMMFGQLTMQERTMSGKGLSRGMVFGNRNNHFNIRMSGLNKNLKQC